MTFAHPAFLLLLLLLPLLWRWQLRPGASRACLALKCAIFSALVLAISGPAAPLRVEKVAVTVLMDTSASMPKQALDHGRALLRELVAKNNGAELRLITFAERARLHPVPRDPDKVAIPSSQDLGSGMATDMEGALQLALSTFPRQGARRVLLISDGNENRGHALTEALRARERGVAVYTMPSGGTARLPVQMESIALPQHVFSGERFTLALRLDSARALPARISVTCQGREIGAAPVQLQAGSNEVNLDARLTGDGVSLLEARIAGDGDERVLFSQAVTVRPPRVLYIAGGDGPSAQLLDTLKQAQVDLETAPAFPTEGAAVHDWDAVVLDDYPDHRLSDAEDSALEKYVSSGGGLIFIAGQGNSQIPEQPRTPLEKMLPVRGDPQPAPEENTALVLVLDKSLSMDGLKIAMAREAARASVINLRPKDRIGVIAFDENYRWVVPMSPASEVERIRRLINSIVADGGTSIYPALQSGYETIQKEQATRKHIILLTDGWSTGWSSGGDYPQLAQQAAENHITISTVGIGNDVNRTLLEELAREAHGKSYFVDNPENIPQIISGEVRALSVSSIQERPVKAVRVRPVESIDGIDFARAPRLLGFVKAKARPGSETILRLDSGEPLLVRWHYGLGRVITFLSDARGRWAAPWVNWDAFGTLWPQLVRDASHRDRTVRAGVRPGDHEGEEIVYYDVLRQSPDQAPDAARESGPPRILVSPPGELSRMEALEETSPGHYEARIPASGRGLYRIVSGSAELMLPEAGFYRESEEMRQREVNLPFLSEISRLTGGRVRPSIEQLLDPKGSLVSERQELWPYWLLLALVLDLFEVALRKGLFERVKQWWQRRRDRHAAPAPEHQPA